MIIGDKKNNSISTFSELLTLFRVYAFILLQWLFSIIPVKRNRILFYVHYRKGYTCNPKYVIEKIIEKGDAKYEMYWVTQYPESCAGVPSCVSVIRANSIKHKIKYLRTAIYITNDCFPAWALHSKKHIWINLWHGGINYKHIGYEFLDEMSKARLIWFRLTNRQPDYFLSGSKFFTRDTSQSFNLKSESFIEYGLPRNDIFFRNDNVFKRKLKKKLGLSEEKKIALFAPTFRSHLGKSENLDICKLKKALLIRFKGDWEILYRKHNFVNNDFDSKEIIDVSYYDDMNELLYITDVLISDYSSCMYDFAIRHKPCFVYAPDIEKYMEKDRGFAYPLSKWPYPIAKSNKELFQNIIEFNEKEYIYNLSKHFIDISSKDNGTASERIVSLIEKLVNERV